MSLILDALNKSDGERPELDAGPGLHARHEPGVGNSTPAWRRWLIPGLVLGLVIAVLAAWLRQAEPTAVADQTPMQNQAAVPAPVENSGPNQREAMEQRKALRDLAVLAAARQAAANAQSGNQARQADVAALYGTPAKGAALPPMVDMESAAAEPAAAPAPVATPVSTEEASALDVDAIARAAELALAEKPIVEHAAPTIDKLSQRTKDDIPSIFFSSHSWSSRPQERSVVLNGETHREGDTIKPGLELLEILEDSIVLDYRGTEFRLRSLNSWVNL